MHVRQQECQHREPALDSKRLSGLAAALTVASPAAATLHPEEVTTGINGHLSFSYADSRGNTDTTAITGDSKLQYVTGGPWLYDARLLFVAREERNISTEERYETRLTANRYWTEEDYLYGRLDWRKDNFGGVREEWVPSAGYGRVLLRSERHDLKGELGAGYRFADLADGTSEEGAALSGGLRYNWKISASAVFFQNLMVQWSQDNTYTESESGLRTNIIGNLNARLSYLIKHNTDVPEGRRNSDFFTTVGLEYTF
jgi:putative salt-induced outer membrane protein